MSVPRNIDQLFNSLVFTGPVRFNRYPANAAGVAVTSGKIYVYGAIASILATGTITVDSWMSSCCVDTLNVADILLVGCTTGAAGSEVPVCEWSGDYNATALGAMMPYNLPRPVFVSSAVNNRLGMEAGAASNNNRTMLGSYVMGTRFRGAGT